MRSINKTMIEHAIKIAHEIKADSLLVCVDVISDITDLLEEIKKNMDFIIIARENENISEETKKHAKILYIPNVNLTRVGRIKIAIAKGIVLGFFKRDDNVVCLSGVPRFGYADSIFVIDVGKEFEILTSDFINDVIENVRPEVFNAALNIACELAAQGRESRKVGTIFVLGDDEKVMQLSRQMIINPLSGYS